MVKKHMEFNTCYFFLKNCHRMIHGSGSMRFEVFQDGKDSTCVRVDLVGGYKVFRSTCCHLLL